MQDFNSEHRRFGDRQSTRFSLPSNDLTPQIPGKYPFAIPSQLVAIALQKLYKLSKLILFFLERRSGAN
ncbi:hypothetical protein ACL6C3_24100 [Capilliphycus salinus ALCB114379]|uniref:hypothetical protein n=1 Tax=Capilliphycus salinus TaxID=2768948 RepID=UPI0039A5C71C